MKPIHERFTPGDIIRYAEGESALLRYDGTHSADRLYGTHVLGGASSACDAIFTKVRLADETDLTFCRLHRPEWFAVQQVKRDEALVTLIHEALRWASFSVGEGFCPAPDNPNARDPALFLMEYWDAVGRDHELENLPDLIRAHITKLQEGQFR